MCTVNNYAQSDYKHVLANILRSRYFARTPPWNSTVQTAAVMLRTPPVDGQSPASQPRALPIYGAQILRTPPVTRLSPASSARRRRPAGRSHYVVISLDGRKLVTGVRVILPQQRNPCPDCKSSQQCTTRGQPLPRPQVTSGSVQQCVCGRGQTDRHTHRRA